MIAQGNDNSPATLRSVDAAISSSRAAMLTAAQFAQVNTLRSLLQQAADSHNDVELQRLAALILSIIREGPPSLF